MKILNAQIRISYTAVYPRLFSLSSASPDALIQIFQSDHCYNIMMELACSHEVCKRWAAGFIQSLSFPG